LDLLRRSLLSVVERSIIEVTEVVTNVSGSVCIEKDAYQQLYRHTSLLAFFTHQYLASKACTSELKDHYYMGEPKDATIIAIWVTAVRSRRYLCNSARRNY
jgi:hypothetical protein